jgi:hypothetical protein
MKLPTAADCPFVALAAYGKVGVIESARLPFCPSVLSPQCQIATSSNMGPT